MKNKISLIAVVLIGLAMIAARLFTIPENKPLKVTEWDAFGYYAYLPAVFIYDDVEQLKWIDSADRKYAVTGGNGWPTEKLQNGNHVLKYFGGVAIMQLPFFSTAAIIAKNTGQPADGFSPPYQYAISIGLIFYCLIAFLLLRKILCSWFSDAAVAMTLLLIALATNFLEYSAIESGMSHGYIFLLYVLQLWATMQWHKRPSVKWATAIGFLIGFAMICRPTEAIMLFIPLFWNTHTKEASKEKWNAVKQHKSHVLFAMLGGLTGILPQLLYWKITTGSFVYDVGSRWDFLLPHFRVLFGWEKGWFIYTPVTIFFILGMFFMKKLPFRKSVLVFCLLNIWIIIAWHEWRYAASYSTRALVQSYPLFALPMAAFIEEVNKRKWRLLFYPVAIYLVLVNLFQLWQYNTGVLHYDEMNRQYYSAIYLDPTPSPLDMSLLDTDEILFEESSFQKQDLCTSNEEQLVEFAANGMDDIAQAVIKNKDHIEWIRTEVYMEGPLWKSFLIATLQGHDSLKITKQRLFNPISKEGKINRYDFYMKVPQTDTDNVFRLVLQSDFDFKGLVKRIHITGFKGRTRESAKGH